MSDMVIVWEMWVLYRKCRYCVGDVVAVSMMWVQHGCIMGDVGEVVCMKWV